MLPVLRQLNMEKKVPVTIYHNPRCSKSRQTLQLLRDRGIDPEIIEYLNTPPDKPTLQRLLNLLGLRPRQLIRQKESVYSQHGLSDPDLTDDELIAAMLADPILIERPIVVADGKAVIGRPPENIDEICGVP